MSELIYIVEDDENIRELIRIALTGYSYNVSAFEDAETAIEGIKNAIPDLCIFDIMLPGIDGITALKKIRENKVWKKIPVILLTAKDSEVDKIKGLDNGADDYMTKPFSVLELMARVRALLRRTEDLQEFAKSNIGSIYEFDGLRINTDTREVFVNGEAATFTFKEYEVLKYLIENQHRVVSRDELLNKIWDYEYTGETRTVDIHIRTMRQKLGEACEMIKTVRGMGYRFNDKK